MPFLPGPAPPRIQIDVDGGTAQPALYRSTAGPLVLRLRWWGFSWFNLVMTLVALPLAGMVGAGLAMVGLALVAPLPIVLVIYVLLGITFNEVCVVANGQEITSSLGPIPLWPARTLALQDVTAIFATQGLRLQSGWGESTNIAWYVAARRGDYDVPITRMLRDREEAVFVARALERAVGIGPGDELDDG